MIIDAYRGWICDQPFAWMRSLRATSAVDPADEQITLAEAQAHLRLDLYGSPLSHPDDSIIESVYIPAARAICESISGRAFAVRSFELLVGAFPVSYAYESIKLGIGPIRGINSLEYHDGTQYLTLDATSYAAATLTDVGHVFPAYSTCWPTAAVVPNAVRIRFTAGYDAPGGSPEEFLLPPDYKLAMLLALGHVYENRENTTTFALTEIPFGVRALLGPDSLVNGFA